MAVTLVFATEEEAKIARVLITEGRKHFTGTGYEEHIADRVVSDITQAVSETYDRAEGEDNARRIC